MDTYLSSGTGFPAGTLVHTEQGWTPIQDIEVGDLVLSKPENGVGESIYKPVINTFVYENKELWLVEVKKHWNDEDINGNIIDSSTYRYTHSLSEFIATSNHPVFVMGMGIWDGQQSLESINPYIQPQWKRVDQLQQYEIVMNKDGVLFYIKRAQPLYQYQDKNLENLDSTIAWYQKNYYVSQEPMETEDIEFYNFEEGTAIDIDYCKNENIIKGSSLTDKPGVGINKDNVLKDQNKQYIPFTDNVYNLEVADDHTYFVTMSGVFVHNTSSPEQTVLSH
ncbi:hypothetical protein [Acinetobacter boissieri]|uniref:Intein C-terminal splicing region n=1 Tax=Acinetobacter boissieri TaxID=1219383 RepID=A0A1G6JPJ2_9GAMM|nr:hypothetical protein [Acinetobacter boissieri]SDC20598.1 intein C-terminal splicing region [Acinetobacter boissieri]